MYICFSSNFLPAHTSPSLSSLYLTPQVLSELRKDAQTEICSAAHDKDELEDESKEYFECGLLGCR